jgi:hypothetical protein
LDVASESFKSSQWSFWPYKPGQEEHIRAVVVAHFDELFAADDDDFGWSGQRPVVKCYHMASPSRLRLGT